MTDKPNYTIRLTGAQLGEIQLMLQAMTPGPYDWGIHPAETIDAAIEWEAGNIRKGVRPTMDMVFIGEVEENTTILCVTGNGPNGAANARGIVTALRALPYLLDEVRAARRARVREVQAAQQPAPGPTTGAGEG